MYVLNPALAATSLAPLMAQMAKNLPAMQETPVQSLGREDPLEKGIATHSSILPWRIPMGRGAQRATVHEVAESDTAEQLSTAWHPGLEAELF